MVLNELSFRTILLLINFQNMKMKFLHVIGLNADLLMWYSLESKLWIFPEICGQTIFLWVHYKCIAFYLYFVFYTLQSNDTGKSRVQCTLFTLKSSLPLTAFSSVSDGPNLSLNKIINYYLRNPFYYILMQPNWFLLSVKYKLHNIISTHKKS